MNEVIAASDLVPGSTTPLVSVVIAAYHHAEYVGTAIASALAQTYSNFEVVVVDDGSIDGTVEAIRAFLPEIIFVQVDRGGPSACLNAGLRACKGAYIAVTSGDDVCNPERLVVQLDHLRATESDITFCLPEIIDGAGQRVPDSEFPVFFGDRTKGAVELADLFYKGNYLCASSAFLRAETLRRIGYFDETLVQLSDYAYWMRALASGLTLRVSPHRTVKYRRHFANLSGPTNLPVRQAEMPYLLKRVVDTAEPGTLREAFNSILPFHLGDAVPLSNFEHALLYFAHDQPAVRSVGLAYYDAALQTGEFDRLPHVDRLGFLINSLGRPEMPGKSC